MSKVAEQRPPDRCCGELLAPHCGQWSENEGARICGWMQCKRCQRIFDRKGRMIKPHR